MNTSDLDLGAWCNGFKNGSQAGWPEDQVSLEEVRNLRAKAVEDLCNRGPETLLDGFTNAVDRHQEVLALIQRSDTAKMARYPRGLVPVGEWIGMQLIELIVHDWDMRKPDDPSVQLTPFAVEPVLKVLPETQMRFVSHRLAEAESLELKDGGYRMCAGNMQWAFRVRNQNVSYEAELGNSFSTSFYTNPETLILLILGRFDVASQLDVGACRFEGNPDIDTSVYDLIFGPYISASVIPPIDGSKE